MLRKLDLGSISGRREVPPTSPALQAVFMRETRILWQGRSMNLTNCYQFYGAARQCSDCPIDHLAATGTRSARIEIMRAI